MMMKYNGPFSERDAASGERKPCVSPVAKAADLPRDPGPQRFGSELWIKLTDCPPEWGVKLLQVNLHAWNASRKAWEETRLATTDREVAAKLQFWQHNLTLLADRDSARAKQWRQGPAALPAGR